MSFTIVDKDIFESTEDYLCHQCNCVTTRAAHMAAAVFKKYPYADIYTRREGQDEPGTIMVCGNKDKGQRQVINMLGQYYPGYSNSQSEDGTLDSYKKRAEYFRSCLIHMSKMEGSFAFPWTIACGAAGGDWGTYITMLKGFEAYIKGDVVIYRLPGK
jgi:hypothetical protein